MKIAVNIITTVVLVVATVMSGCSKEEYTDLYNSWRFIGFGESGSRGIIPVEPVDCDYCYTITFHKDGTFEGWSVRNKFSGKFEVSGNNISITYLSTTLVGEWGDAGRFHSNIRDFRKFYVEEYTLKMFYSDTTFFLFSPTSP